MHHGNVTPQIAQSLLALRARIQAAKIPSSKLDETLNVAVWNIREFGNKRRSDAAIHYIAEILGQFDLVALVELRSNLTDLGRVLPILGEYWDVVYSDWIADSGGNNERIAYLFDKRAVVFNGLAAEVDAPRAAQAEEYLARQSFWRAPYMCSFRAGNFDFVAVTTHARWGHSLTGRQAELQLLADWIDTRFKDRFVEDHDLVVMGDFNIPEVDDALFNALTSRGLQIPAPLRKLQSGDRVIGGTNLEHTARYDQILHLPTVPANFMKAGGTLDFFIDDAHIEELFPGKKYTRQQFSFQLSDHLPLWIQMKTDIDGHRLDQIVQAGRKV
jgi:endonuclease/exonuclease/phosphatase family metal-dependent hydrolase